MEYKCPGCGKSITIDNDVQDCHSCGESLIQFWQNIKAAQQKKTEEDNRSKILEEMQACTDNLEKGFQELLTGKFNGAMKFYFNKLALENNPSQFAEYSDKDDYRAAYKKLSFKYESYAGLLNQKLKSAKTLKLGIAAAVTVVVLIATVATVSSLTRKETNITVEGGKSEVAVNINNNTGSSSVNNTSIDSSQNSSGESNININNNIIVNEKSSEYDSYIFENPDAAVNYFLKTKDWVEKAKCCNYPDNAILLLNAVKNKMGDKFLKYKVSKKQESNIDGYSCIYTLKGNGPELKLKTCDESQGYRIDIFNSIYNYGCENNDFLLEKSSEPSAWILLCKIKTDDWDYGNHKDMNSENIELWDRRNKYNTENSYQLWGYDKTTDEFFYVYVDKASEAGKKIYEILKTGGYQRPLKKWHNQYNTKFTKSI